MAGSEDLDTKWLASLLKKSFHDQKPSDLEDVSATLATAVGENFLSTVHRVKLTMILASGRRKQFSIIVKNERDGGLVKKVMGSLNLFPIEIKVYTVIFPMMKELMEEFGDNRDALWSECLGFKPYSTIVMEDLSFQRYTSIDRTKWHSIEQSQFVLRELARFHAMTKILISRGLLTEDDRGHNLFVGDTQSTRNIFPGGLIALSRAIRNKWGEEWQSVAQKIERNAEVICDKMLAASKYDEKFEVLNHGDVWSSNIMWKFTEYGGVPFSIKMIDWQFTHINSFIVDLTYFLHTSVVPSLRRAHMDLLLDTYQEALERNLKFFQWEGYIPTKQDMRTEMKRVDILSFVFVALCMPVTSTGISGLSFDIGAMVEIPAEDCFKEEIFTEEKFVREVAPDLKVFNENGII